MTHAERSSRNRPTRSRAALKALPALVLLVGIGLYVAADFSWYQSVRCVRGPRPTDLQCGVRQTRLGMGWEQTVIARDFRSARFEHRGKTYYLVVDTATTPVDIVQAVGIGEDGARVFASQVAAIADGTGETATVEGRPSASGMIRIAMLLIEGMLLIAIARVLWYVFVRRRE